MTAFPSSIALRLTGAAAFVTLAPIAAAQANDDCSGAIAVSTGSTFFDSTGATNSAPGFWCETTGGADIWYVFTAPTTDFYRFDLSSANYDSVIEVSDGACGGLNPIGCNDDGSGAQSWTTIPCVAGTDYYVRIGGYNGQTGDGTLDITQTAPRDLSLFAHYTLDEAGMDVFDQTAYAQDGIQFNCTPGVAGAAAGTGTAFEFDGTTSYIEIFGNGALDILQNDFSVSFWFNADAFPADTSQWTEVARVFGNDGPGGSWSFGINDIGGLTLTTHAVLDYDIAAPLMLGTWHHAVIVMDIMNDCTFYVDGNLVGTVDGIEQGRSPVAAFFMGAWDPFFTIPQFFDGKIDDLQVYGGALTVTDVMTLHANPGTTVGSGSGLGMNYCMANPNSTGLAGVMSGAGSNVAADNDVTLMASNLPVGQFGIFVTSMVAGSTPVGAGNLCLSGSIGRYTAPSQILQANANGEFSLALDLNLTPQGAGFVPINAGETWYFQAWHRDTSGGIPTSNFTDGYQIDFQ